MVVAVVTDCSVDEEFKKLERIAMEVNELEL